jgi:galactose-6-phosphate isomerase
MPSIDLSRALARPSFQDSFAVTRRQQSVNTYGEASAVSTSMGTQSGVVWPSQPNERKIVPDLTVTDKTITIITAFALRSEAEVSGTEYLPDIVTWHGDSFLVRNVEDWSGYGAGFVQAICSSIDVVDQPTP